MIKSLIQKRNLILIIFVSVLLALCIVTLVFGNTDDKVIVVILSFIVPSIIYGFIRLIYKIIRITASLKSMAFFYAIFLFFGAFGIIMMLIEYITWFPNGLTIGLGSSQAIFIAALDEIKKTETKK